MPVRCAAWRWTRQRGKYPANEKGRERHPTNWVQASNDSELLLAISDGSDCRGQKSRWPRHPKVFFRGGRCWPDPMDGRVSPRRNIHARHMHPIARSAQSDAPCNFEEAPKDHRAWSNIFQRTRWILKRLFDLLPKYSQLATASRPRMNTQPKCS